MSKGYRFHNSLSDIAWPGGGHDIYPLAEIAREEPVQPILSLRTPMSLGSADPKFDRSRKMLGLNNFRVLIISQGIKNSGHEASSIDGICLHMAHDHLNRDVFRRMPAIVVRRHADHLVGDLRLTSELRLRETRHVDDTPAPGAVEVAFCAGGELRSLYSSQT